MANGISEGKSVFRILGLSFLAFILIAIGTIACSSSEEGISEEKDIEQGIIPFAGTVKIVMGQYIYIPEFQGFDVIVQGSLNSGDLASLVGKEVRGEGKYMPERPSILVADTVEVKEGEEFQAVFTRTEDAVLEDLIDLQARNEFVIIEGLEYNKNESWEAQEKIRVYGQLEETEGNFKIVVLDDEGKQIGNVLVDNITDFARYYLQKLNLFEHFWFYVNVKETVEWRDRRRSRDLFHADLVFAGLF